MTVKTRLPAYFRLDPQIGWHQSSISDGVEVDPITQNLTLTHLNRRLSPLTDGSGAFGGKTLPTGVAVGPEGVVVVADPAKGELLVSPHQGLFGEGGNEAPAFVPLWPAIQHHVEPTTCDLTRAEPARSPYDLVAPRGVAFSQDSDLLVVDGGDDQTAGRLIVYTWPDLRVRTEQTLGGEPWDIMVSDVGLIYIADASRGVVRQFDRAWRRTGWQTTQDALHRPKHLSIANDGTLYIVDTDPETGAGRLSRSDRIGRVAHLDDAEQTEFWSIPLPPPIQKRGEAFFIPGNVCTEHGAPLHNLTLDRRGRLPQGPILRYTTLPGRLRRKGTYVSEALDSESFAFAWHRLVLDIDLGDIGALEIQTYTSASFLEPSRIDNLPDSAWSRRIVLTPKTPKEALIQSPPGRYLWLRLGFVGDGVTGPKIRSIDIGQPRNSSLRFLPAPFHEDPEARDFLDRFLSYFDTVFAEIDHDVGLFSAHLGPRGAPEGPFLTWLASWFDIKFLASWDDATRRAFLAQAMDLHRARGTIAGLKMLLRLHLAVAEPMPVLLESFRLRNFAARRHITSPDLPLGGLRIGGRPLQDSGGAHRFFVVAPAAAIPNDDARQSLRKLVDQFKPAHTAWELIEVQPGFRIGCQSMVGVDSLISDYPSAPLGSGQIGMTAHLTGPPHNLPKLGRDKVISRH